MKITTYILKQQRGFKKIFLKYFVLTICLLISALYYNIILNPAKIVSGGVNGIATILNHTIGMDPSVLILVSSTILLIISLFFLGIEYSSSAFYITIIYPFFVKMTSSLTGVISIQRQDLLICVIFAGILCGITNGAVYRIGFSSGGLNIISQLLYKYKRISVSLSGLIINIIVVGVGGFIFGVSSILYALVYLYVSKFVTDKILLGISDSKAFYIISRKADKIDDIIRDEYGYGTTTFNTKGGRIFDHQKVIMSVIPTKDYYALKQMVREIDKKAFIVITDSYEVKGGK